MAIGARLIGLALVSLDAASAARRGSGGSSIASAPKLPLGRFVNSGWVNQPGGEFWRVPVRTGDRLVIDYGVASHACDVVRVDIFAPRVTDYTLGSSSPVAEDENSGKSELVWIAPISGKWTIRFDECSTNAYRFRGTLTSAHLPSALGARSIAGARSLPLARTYASGWVNQPAGEYWRLNVRAGNRVAIDFAVVGRTCDVARVDVFAPTVSDYTLGQNDPVAEDETSSTHELLWTAPKAGRWVVRFDECSTNAIKFKVLIRRH